MATNQNVRRGGSSTIIPKYNEHHNNMLSAYDTKTKTFRYIVLFHEKDKRKNKRDDKHDILRAVVGHNLIGDTPDNYAVVSNRTPGDKYDRTPGISKPRHKYDTTDYWNPIRPSSTAILDINRYKLPVLFCNLTEEQSTHLQKDPNVKRVQPVKIYKPHVQTVPWGITRLKAHEGWSAGTNSKGAGVFVGDIDTGCDTTHEDLGFSQWTDFRGWGHSFDEGDNTLTDDAGHGTHTMGTILAQDNDLGVVGVAPEARPFVIKVSTFTLDAIMSGVEFCMSYQIQATNNSYGDVTPGTNNWLEAEETQWYQSATDFHMINCASAGNEDVKNMRGTWTTADKTGILQTYPAGYLGLCEISASQQEDLVVTPPREYFGSNCGTKTEFIAPGYEVQSTVPIAMGSYDIFSGTSMACPHATGFMCLAYANLIREYCSDTYSFGVGANTILRLAARATADKLGAFSDRAPNDCYGWGFPQCDKVATEVATAHDVTGSNIVPSAMVGLSMAGPDEIPLILPASDD